MPYEQQTLFEQWSLKNNPSQAQDRGPAPSGYANQRQDVDVWSHLKHLLCDDTASPPAPAPARQPVRQGRPESARARPVQTPSGGQRRQSGRQAYQEATDRDRVERRQEGGAPAGAAVSRRLSAWQEKRDREVVRLREKQ
ncbi:hypothetical protein KIPB_012368, partial [Kipferlia bialata]|eukprot:g12368.t1